ncbi:LCP family glycopolymer transferase [Paenibacillus algicola]|nr:LCP family protein [Paenibacillus algicola]
MRKIMKITTLVLGALLLGTGIYAYSMYHSVKKTADEMFEERTPLPPTVLQTEPVSKGNKPKATQSDMAAVIDTEAISIRAGESVPAIQANLDQKEPFTVLVMGVDEREHDRGRSDAMILLSVNPARESILMFNIPRDTRTAIAGHGTVDKINHAYAFGGVDMSVRTVELFLQVPVHFYVKVNMEGFARIIDTLGGVRVQNTMAFDYGGYHFTQGSIELTGDQALAYSRMRFEDPRGDLGRNTRQRQIVDGVLQKSLQMSTVFSLNELLEGIGSSVRTDITFEEMKILMTKYRKNLHGTKQIEIQGSGATIGGIWYYIVEAKERQRIRSILVEHMQPPQ